ncbi:hypothetical protein SSE37_15938, partial [Sagittula stellata E-37]
MAVAGLRRLAVEGAAVGFCETHVAVADLRLAYRHLVEDQRHRRRVGGRRRGRRGGGRGGDGRRHLATALDALLDLQRRRGGAGHRIAACAPGVVVHRDADQPGALKQSQLLAFQEPHRPAITQIELRVDAVLVVIHRAAFVDGEDAGREDEPPVALDPVDGHRVAVDDARRPAAHKPAPGLFRHDIHAPAAHVVE